MFCGVNLGDEWKILERERAEAVLRALAHPTRRTIYELLGGGPVRQHKLAGQLEAGRRYGDSLLRHHLGPLRKAGLIDFLVEGDAKYVRRKLDIRIQARSRPEERPIHRGRAETEEEARARVREVFARRRRR